MRVYNDALPKNILRGKVPTATLWDGQVGFAYQAKTGGTVFTDFSAAANNATANDVTFFDATMQAQDAFYFGENFSTSNPFNSLLINLGTSGVYNATGVWEYWNGAWVTLTVTDLTTGLKAAPGSYYVTWTIPADMTHTTVNAQDKYWVRFRISAFTSKTTVPLGTQIWLGRYPTSLANITDGSMSTVSGLGVVLMGAVGIYGNLIFDLGVVKTVLFGGRLGLYSSTNVVIPIIATSDDNNTYRPTPAQVSNAPARLAISVTSATEVITDSFAVLVTGRYVKIMFYVGAAATSFANIYDCKAYEVGA